VTGRLPSGSRARSRFLAGQQRASRATSFVHSGQHRSARRPAPTDLTDDRHDAVSAFIPTRSAVRRPRSPRGRVRSRAMVALGTGVVSALVALVCALWAARTSRVVAQLQAVAARELAESANSRLDRERAEELQRKIAQYREPLARAAYDLLAWATPREHTQSTRHYSYFLSILDGSRYCGARRSF
jgi:hypothetical protein